MRSAASKKKDGKEDKKAAQVLSQTMARLGVYSEFLIIFHNLLQREEKEGPSLASSCGRRALF